MGSIDPLLSFDSNESMGQDQDSESERALRKGGVGPEWLDR